MSHVNRISQLTHVLPILPKWGYGYGSAWHTVGHCDRCNRGYGVYNTY